jgi:hypothetical protein
MKTTLNPSLPTQKMCMSNSCSSTSRRKHVGNQAEVLKGQFTPDSFAWLELLPPNDRRAFLDEFSRTLIASADIDTYERLDQLVQEWRATADIHAQPGLAKRLGQPAKSTEGRSIAAPGDASSTAVT